jgi:uncharacterized protein (DUF3820 family)
MFSKSSNQNTDAYKNIKLNFGKYKDKTLEYIYDEDPEYLKWLNKNYQITEKTSPTMKAVLKWCKSKNLLN